MRGFFYVPYLNNTGTLSVAARELASTILQMLGVFAEFETNLRQERQAAGIAKAKLERPEVYSGRPATIDAEAIRKLLGEGFKPVDVAQRLGISRASVYRYKSKNLF